MKDLVLAHDLGTTGNKASLFDRDGQLVASAFSGYTTDYPQPGWAEQCATDWWRAVVSSTQELLQRAAVRPDQIAVISFSGQMMGCLPVDRGGTPLRPAIIWADQRAEAQAQMLIERVGWDRVYRVTGHRASSSYSGAKMAWIRDEQPQVFARTAKMLQAKDYVAYRLTGVYATDYSDASGTNLFNLSERRWSGAMCEAMGIDPQLLPQALPSGTVIGGVTAEAARETGLAQGTPVAIGGGDGACATAGAGVVQPGDAYCYVGSSAWISFVSHDPLYDPQKRTFSFAHLDPDYVFPTGTMQCAGGSYDWLERLLRGEDGESMHAELDALASEVAPGAQGLFFLPYLMGERSPHWNPKARGVFVGLTMTHGRAEMARAVLEGVAFNLRTILQALTRQGAPIEALRVIGGGARSALWRQILADVLDHPLLRTELSVEATSLGAAVAGGVAVGLFDDYAVVQDLVRVSPGERPEPAAAARYAELYDVFAETYEALEPIYERIAAL
ncbi:MAG: xylulokinase [Chloroflexota bacterium]|nr:xylulokinase [Chloroflexota bacterium]